eukprot:scaffold7345_cov129-Isochrysis_galbana.AAC.1
MSSIGWGPRVPRPARFAAGRACRLVTSAWLHSTRSSQTELPASVCNFCVPVQVQATRGGLFIAEVEPVPPGGAALRTAAAAVPSGLPISLGGA